MSKKGAIPNMFSNLTKLLLVGHNQSKEKG